MRGLAAERLSNCAKASRGLSEDQRVVAPGVENHPRNLHAPGEFKFGTGPIRQHARAPHHAPQKKSPRDRHAPLAKRSDIATAHRRSTRARPTLRIMFGIDALSAHCQRFAKPGVLLLYGLRKPSLLGTTDYQLIKGFKESSMKFKSIT